MTEVNHNFELKKFIKNEELANLFYSQQEHYALLSTISNQYSNELLYDIGTYKGLSALALSSNKRNLVISYDVNFLVEIDRPENVEFRVGNFYNDTNIGKSPLIVFDIDPHDGVLETRFVEYLVRIGYRGQVIFDDIHYGEGMERFWNSITHEKQDLTNVGHWSGTGLVTFK